MDQEELKKIALRYGSLVGAVLGGQTSIAQVAYVSVEDTLQHNNAQRTFNIDNDTSGLMDYRIIQYVDTTQFSISGSFIQARGFAQNQVVGLDYGNYYYPFRLDMGTLIGPDTIFKGLGTSRNWGQLALEVNDTTYPNDKFRGASDAFIGLRFGAFVDDTIRTHYGWMRVDVASDHRSIVIRDYAYQVEAETPIMAGEGMPGFSIEEDEVPMPSMSQRGEYLHVEFPEEIMRTNGTLVIRDMQGRPLREYKIEERQTRLRLEDLPKGIHVATLDHEGRRHSLKVVVY